MRVATWNVNSLNVRLPQVLDWLSAQSVDLLGLQELKMEDAKFPHEALAEAGYHAICFGQRSYNGVAWLSRLGAFEAVQRNIPNFTDASARLLAATISVAVDATVANQKGAADAHDAATVQGLRVICGYMPNGQAPGSDKFEYKLAWFRALRDYLREQLAVHSHLLLVGDYNITFDDQDVWDPAGMAGAIHCTDEERHQLRELLALGLADAFRLFEQPPKSYSWWDYRELGFRRNRGMRIDHMLVSDALRPMVQRCTIDRNPRGNERPSDHAPVVLDLALSGVGDAPMQPAPRAAA
ncbi:MAG: exodeoxyribonuclease III [Burkholderiaceae bacterium]